MQHDSFVRARQDDWRRLEQLLAQLDKKGWRTLQAQDLEALTSLYLGASSDLAQAATHFPQGQTHRYLNALVARTHARLYGTRTTTWRGILAFFWYRIPETFWRLWRPILLAFLLFLAGALAGAAAAHWQPHFAASLVPAQFRDLVASGGSLPKPGNPDASALEAPMMSSYIMVNNIQVSALAFALGATAGLGTAYVLFQNGLLMGVLAVLFSRQWALLFWSLILPHGVIELTAIFLAGGAGLHFAAGLIHPGDLPRSAALARHGREAITLVVAVVPMLITAGLIEGFITPSPVAPGVKLTIAALTFLPLAVYLWPRRLPAFKARLVPSLQDID